MKNTKIEQQSVPHVTKGSILDDLGLDSSEVLEIKVKADIYRELMHYIRSKRYSQSQLMTKLCIHQPDVSNLLNGRVSKFSVTRLLKFAGKLNLGATILLTPVVEAKPLKNTTVEAKASKRELTTA